MEKQLKYPKQALLYAEYVLKSYPQAKVMLEDEVYSAAYSIFSASRHAIELGIRVISHKQSDPTYDAAMKLLNSPAFVHLAMIVRAVDATLNALPHYRWFIRMYFWEGNTAHDLESKRMRRQVLTTVCYYLGVPAFFKQRKKEDNKDALA